MCARASGRRGREQDSGLGNLEPLVGDAPRALSHGTARRHRHCPGGGRRGSPCLVCPDPAPARSPSAHGHPRPLTVIIATVGPAESPDPGRSRGPPSRTRARSTGRTWGDSALERMGGRGDSEAQTGRGRGSGRGGLRNTSSLLYAPMCTLCI